MKFEVDKQERVVVVTSKVEKLDALCAPELKGELVLANKEGHRNMVLDLSETRYIDSSGLSAVLIGHRACRDANGTFVLSGLQPAVAKLVTISQLDSVLKIVPTAEGSDRFRLYGGSRARPLIKTYTLFHVVFIQPQCHCGVDLGFLSHRFCPV